MNKYTFLGHNLLWYYLTTGGKYICLKNWSLSNLRSVEIVFGAVGTGWRNSVLNWDVSNHRSCKIKKPEALRFRLDFIIECFTKKYIHDHVHSHFILDVFRDHDFECKVLKRFRKCFLYHELFFSVQLKKSM